MQNTVKEILIQYIEYKNIRKRNFCLTCGFSEGFINSMRKSIQPDKISSIALNYPDLNTGWLLTGEGEMLKEESPEKELLKEKMSGNVVMPREVFDMLMQKDRIIASQQETIKELSKTKDVKGGAGGAGVGSSAVG